MAGIAPAPWPPGSRRKLDAAGPRGSAALAAAQKASLPCAELRTFGLKRESRNFDLLHAHDARAHTLAAIFSAVPFVVSRRVAFPIKKTALSRWKYGQAERYLAVSRFVARELYAAEIEGDRVDIVYDGVPVPPSASGGDLILTPQSDDPGKCRDLAMDAAARAGIQIQASDNLERDLPHAKALLYLSRSEGLGSGILLGMAHGVTVIASNTGGIPELIDDGVTGILTPNDVDSVSAALTRIDRRFGVAARQKVLERFAEKHMLTATIESYRKATARA